MKLYLFAVVLFVSFMIGCGGGEKKPAGDPQPDEVIEEVVEVTGPSSGGLETLPETATEKPEEEVDTGLIDSGVSIDPVAPVPGGGEPAAPVGGGEPPAPEPDTGTETPAPAVPATDPLAPVPAAGAAIEPATDPLAPAPAAGAATDPLALPAAEPVAEPAAAAPAEPAIAIRKWTDSSGTRSFNAEFVSFKDGNLALKKEDGKVIELPLEKFSQADQDYVKSLNP